MRKLADILEGAGARPAFQTEGVDVAGIACDSRKVEPGYLFVAVRGPETDGHAFVSQAVARGAAAIVGERIPEGVRTPFVQVGDSRKALARIALNFYGRPERRLRLVGITGTNGKTTTAFLVRHLLESEGRKTGLIGTIAHEWNGTRRPASNTTPGALELAGILHEMVEGGCSHAVMEVSSHALDQERVEGLSFEEACFTSFTQDHLDYHGTLETYFASKRKLFDHVSKGGWAVLNADDPWIARLAEHLNVPTLRVGIDAPAEVRAEEVRLSLKGTVFRLATPLGTQDVRTGLIGRHNVTNVLTAAACALKEGISLDAVCRALSTASAPAGRLESIPNDRGLVIFVDYAHTEDALQRALETLRPFASKRIWVVFGCGGDRDRLKRPKMGRVAGHLADHAILTADNPRSEDPNQICAEIAGGFERPTYEIEVDRARAIRKALFAARPGDVVLVAGKGHETSQISRAGAVSFDDRVVVRQSLAELAR